MTATAVWAEPDFSESADRCALNLARVSGNCEDPAVQAASARLASMWSADSQEWSQFAPNQ